MRSRMSRWTIRGGVMTAYHHIAPERATGGAGLALTSAVAVFEGWLVAVVEAGDPLLIGRGAVGQRCQGDQRAEEPRRQEPSRIHGREGTVDEEGSERCPRADGAAATTRSARSAHARASAC